MGRQTCGGGNSTATDRLRPATALADVVPIAGARHRGAIEVTQDRIHLRQEAVAGELSPRSPAPPSRSAVHPDHPSCAWRPARTRHLPALLPEPPDDAA